jgi:hydrogenase maturation protease
MNPRLFIAGIGNVFLRDDGFGVEVVRRLQRETLPPGTTIGDYGVRGLHLAFELLSAPDLLVLIDATQRHGRPGTLYLIDPEQEAEPLETSAADPHAMDVTAVFATLRRLGGVLPRTRIVGCEPADLSEGMQLSDPVREAIEPAIVMIRQLLESEVLDHAKEIEKGTFTSGSGAPRGSRGRGARRVRP